MPQDETTCRELVAALCGEEKARIPLAFSLAVRPIRVTIEGAMTAAREACRAGDSRTGVSRTPGHRPASSSPAWPGPGLSDSTRPRILIIDDEPQISGFVGRVLEKAGYQVDIAADAADGVRSAAGGGSHGYRSEER